MAKLCVKECLPRLLMVVTSYPKKNPVASRLKTKVLQHRQLGDTDPQKRRQQKRGDYEQGREKKMGA